MIFKPDTIYSLKLATGEEIVAKVVGQTDTAVEITKPLTIGVGPQGLQMVPSLFGGNPDRKIQLNKNSVVMVTDARDELVSSYIEGTTGIKPVTKGSILMG